MKPNEFVKRLKEYPLASHKAWDRKDHTRVLKMDWNEADVQLPASVKKAVVDFLMHGPTHWYPDIANRKLIHAIARYASIPDAYVQYFVGEDCALDYIVRTFVSPGDHVVLAAPTYDNFRVFVESVGAVPKFVFGANLFKPDISALARGITKKTKLLYLVNPNNPTGVLYTVAELEKLLKKFPKVMFVVDEAYYEFSGVTAMPLVKKYKNLIVGRSFSKAFGLASFRLGYIATAPENLGHINKIRNGKSISALAQMAAVAALAEPAYVKNYVREMRKSRALMCRELTRSGFLVKETPANFILVGTQDPKSFCRALEEKDIFIRNLGHLKGMERYVRVTVGSMKSTKKFLAAIKELKAKGKLA